MFNHQKGDFMEPPTQLKITQVVTALLVVNGGRFDVSARGL